MVRQTGLNDSAVRRAILGGSHRTNYTVAGAIADLFGVSVAELDWPNEITHLGRPAFTGKPFEVDQQVDPCDVCEDCYTVRSCARTCLCA